MGRDDLSPPWSDQVKGDIDGTDWSLATGKTDLLLIKRQSHYQKYFSDNKKNSKPLWQRIHEII